MKMCFRFSAIWLSFILVGSIGKASPCDFEKEVIRLNQASLIAQMEPFNCNFPNAKALIVFELNNDGTVSKIRAFRRFNGFGCRVMPNEKDFENLELELITKLKNCKKLIYCPRKIGEPLVLMLIFDSNKNPRLSLDFFWTLIQFQSRERDILSPVSGGNLDAASTIVPGFRSQVEGPDFPGKGSKKSWQAACLFYCKGIALSNDYAMARSAFERAIALYPWDDRFYKSLGNLCTRNRNFKDALHYYRSGKKIAPKNMQALYSQLIESSLEKSR